MPIEPITHPSSTSSPAVADHAGAATAHEAAPYQLYRSDGVDNPRIQPNAASFWLQLRGRSRIESREGRLLLLPDQWLTFDHDSAPCIDTDADSLLIGLSVSPPLLRQIEQQWRIEVHPGEGSFAPARCRLLDDTWRRCAGVVADDSRESAQTLRRLLASIRDAQPELEERLARCPGRRRSRQRQVFSRLQRMRLYLRGNVHRAVSLEELAQFTSYSPWWLSKTFRHVYGQTLKSYALSLRIDHACRLLAETDLSIIEISHDCGFDSPCSFARRFRQHMNCTASEYRVNSSAKKNQA